MQMQKLTGFLRVKLMTLFVKLLCHIFSALY